MRVCATCTFWVPKPTSDMPPDYGECRIRAPRTHNDVRETLPRFGNAIVGATVLRGRWPCTHRSEGCGEHAARGEF